MYRYFNGGTSLLTALQTDTYPGRSDEHDEFGNEVRSHPQQHRAARTVKRIQAAARTAANHSSPDQVTVNEIAGHAAIHPRTFYRYFNDVDAVMASIGLSPNTSKDGPLVETLKVNSDDLRHAPQKSNATRTLERLQVAARQLIDEVGVDRLTTSDVAERAGVSIGTFYRYFRDRVALLDALHPDRHDVEKLRAELSAERARTAAAWEEGFRAGRDAMRRDSQRCQQSEKEATGPHPS